VAAAPLTGEAKKSRPELSTFDLRDKEAGTAISTFRLAGDLQGGPGVWGVKARFSSKVSLDQQCRHMEAIFVCLEVTPYSQLSTTPQRPLLRLGLAPQMRKPTCNERE